MSGYPFLYILFPHNLFVTTRNQILKWHDRFSEKTLLLICYKNHKVRLIQRENIIFLVTHSAEVNDNITKKLNIIQIIPHIALFRFY